MKNQKKGQQKKRPKVVKKNKKKNPCWKGYRKVKGKKNYSPKSCVKK